MFWIRLPIKRSRLFIIIIITVNFILLLHRLSVIQSRERAEIQLNIYTDKDIDNWRFSTNYDWPFYRRKVLRDDFWNENIEKNALGNIEFKDYWPIVENSTNYVLYECLNMDLCGGWGNRLQGILVSYFLALMSRRQLIINIQKPCDLKTFFKPNLVHWDKNISNGLVKVYDYIDSYPDKISPSDLNNLLKDLLDSTVKVVSFKTGQFGYLKYFSIQRQFRELLLNRGFRENDLIHFNYLQLPLKVSQLTMTIRKKEIHFHKCANTQTNKKKSFFLHFFNNAIIIIEFTQNLYSLYSHSVQRL